MVREPVERAQDGARELTERLVPRPAPGSQIAQLRNRFLNNYSGTLLNFPVHESELSSDGK
jgi:hypothetical protein